MAKAKYVAVLKDIPVSEHTVEIVGLLANGKTLKGISEELNVNQRTLEARIVVIKNDFNATTLMHLVAIFFRNKLIK